MLKPFVFIYLCRFVLLFVSASLVDNNVVDRIDCHPEHGATQQKCVQRGCVWLPSIKSPGPPPCFYNGTTFGYKVVNDTATTLGQSLHLQIRSFTSGNHGYVQFNKPTVDVEMQTESRMRIKFYDRSEKRYEVPVGQLFPRSVERPLKTNYVFNYTDDSNFHVYAKRKDGVVKIWDTSVGALILSDQFLELSTRLPSENLYGFGEKTSSSFKQTFDWRTIGMFSRDQFPYPDVNLYGVHPFYVIVEDDGSAHGVMLLNSNAMEVKLQPNRALTHRTIGGIFDFYFFFGPTPENVVQQYTEFVGRPILPSYWTLGFQLCRWGYNSLAEVKRTVDRMRKYDIPQDVQYGDIDYMHRQLDFVIKNDSYGGLGEYVRHIKEDGIKYITILDPAISYEETPGSYEALDLGNELDIWIKNQSGLPIVGKVWPDKKNVTKNSSWTFDDQVKFLRAEAVFPDFFHENITSWWNVLIKKFHKTLEFDGLWIDMNEVANFVPGSVNGCPKNNNFENPPYTPKIANSLVDKTLCMSAVHQDGELEYNYHSLFGWKQSQITMQALSDTTNKRGIVVSRSTYISSGKYIGHWLGDNKSDWPDMHWSIIGMMEMSLFGIPYVGADICGFFLDAKYNLCLRWMQLGAFYPYSRNHNGYGQKAQDPANFGEEFANISRSVLHARYTLLPYLYTLFYRAHVNGDTVVRPLFHEFPQDKTSLDIDRQFLWGSSLLITPVLEENATTVEAYIPNDTWYDYYTQGKVDKSKIGKKHVMSVPLDKIGLHLRGGNILPTQEPARNTMRSRGKPFGLLVMLSGRGEASGQLFWDDGDSLDSVAQKKFLELKFTASKLNVTSSVQLNGYSPAQQLYFNKISIMGVTDDSVPETVKINGNSNSDVKIFLKSQVLRLENLKLPINESFTITFDDSENSSSERIACSVWMVCLSWSLFFFSLSS